MHAGHGSTQNHHACARRGGVLLIVDALVPAGSEQREGQRRECWPIVHRGASVQCLRTCATATDCKCAGRGAMCERNGSNSMTGSPSQMPRYPPHPIRGRGWSRALARTLRSGGWRLRSQRVEAVEGLWWRVPGIGIGRARRLAWLRLRGRCRAFHFACPDRVAPTVKGWDQGCVKVLLSEILACASMFRGVIALGYSEAVLVRRG